MYEGLVESFCSAAQAQEFILVCACWESEGVCVQARAALGRKSLSTTDLDSRSHSRPSEFLTISHSTLSRRLWSINLRSPQSPLAAPVWPSLSFFWPASGVLKCFRREFRRADRNWNWSRAVCQHGLKMERDPFGPLLSEMMFTACSPGVAESLGSNMSPNVLISTRLMETVAEFGRMPRKTSPVYRDRFTRIIFWLHSG